MATTETRVSDRLRGLPLVAGMALMVALIQPCWGEGESHHPPLSNRSLSTLDLGFKNQWSTPHKHVPCATPCFPFSADIPVGVEPDRQLSYEEDFRLNLGESGPLSFQFSGSRLKMEVEF